MLRCLNSSLAYKLDQVDPGLDSTRDEGEARLGPMRALLRCASKSVDGLCDPSSVNSMGAILALKRGPEQGADVLRMILDSGAPKKPRLCLIHSSNKLIGVDEADELDEATRAKCIAIQSSEQLALPVVPEEREPPHVIVTFSKQLIGGNREAKVDLTRVGDCDVSINTISAAGTRKKLTVSNIPRPIVEKLFAPAENVVPKSSGLPSRRGELPGYLKAAVAEFLERRVRLQALATAAVPSPATRPVVLEKAYTRSSDTEKKNQLSIGAMLHTSSSACICGAHGLRFDWKGCVDIKIETCGRKLQRIGEYVRCPCHEKAIDDSGNSRFNIEGICTEGTAITVTCFHRQGSVCKRGVCVDCIKLTNADRLELSTMLVNLAEFNTRVNTYFDDKGWPTDRDSLAIVSDYMSDKLRKSMEDVERLQLTEQDPEVNNPRELLRRDMTVVDLLRGGGVFRHVHKRGNNRGAPYIQRAKKTDTTPPLKSHETAVADTHAHLFRKARMS